jgi:hypothetical protein
VFIMPFNFSAFEANLILIALMFYLSIHDQVPRFSCRSCNQQGRLNLGRELWQRFQPPAIYYSVGNMQEASYNLNVSNIN